MAVDSADFEIRSPARVVSVVPATSFLTGKPVFYDGFESAVLKWDETLANSATAQLTSANSFNGENSYQMKLAAGIGSQVQLRRRLGFLGKHQMGIELWWAVDDDIDFDFLVQLVATTGTETDQIQVSYSNADEQWYSAANHAASNAITGASQAITRDAMAWNHFKWVLDLENGKWRTFQSNELDLDVSDISLSFSSSSNDPVLSLLLFATAREATALNVYWDDVLVTLED